jgi:hypothetical protein
MNVSHKHNHILLTPNKCASKIVKQILHGYDFLEQPDESFHNLNYKLISTIRNPYDWIFSIFINFELISVFLNKSLKDDIKKHFNKWIQKFILSEKLVATHNFSLKISIDDIHLYKDLFNKRIPNFFIRMENIQEDLEKLDFIKNDLSWDLKKNEEELKTNKYKIHREYTFNSMYDIETAKKVYFYYKKHFNLADYDPFSFTTEILTEKEKINFIHDIL